MNPRNENEGERLLAGIGGKSWVQTLERLLAGSADKSSLIKNWDGRDLERLTISKTSIGSVIDGFHLITFHEPESEEDVPRTTALKIDLAGNPLELNTGRSAADFSKSGETCRLTILNYEVLSSASSPGGIERMKAYFDDFILRFEFLGEKIEVGNSCSGPGR